MQKTAKRRFEEFLNTVTLAGQFSQTLKPPPRRTISQWAEDERMLSSEEAAFPGPWYNDVIPFAVEVMNAISDPVTRRVVLMWGAQVGKTNLLLNTIGCHMSDDPCPIMVVQPTITMGETFSGKRLTPMIRDTPCLRGKIADEKSRSSGNTIKEKTFPGGYIVISGANSAASLKSRPVRVLLFDEVDEAPANLEGQGDPVQLAIGRTTRFPNRKIVLASTPTIKNRSRIETAYQDSSQEKWAHGCPDCGEWSTFSWRRLSFETLDMACPHCGVLHSRRAWEQKPGKWIADNPGHPTRGFHISSLDAPDPTWPELVAEWIEAEGKANAGSYELKIAFTNMRLAETWEVRGEAVESHALETRREKYRAELPDGVCVLTMGVDVQDSRLAYEVVGWGLGFENWAIEYGELWGDPRQGEVWDRLDDVLARSWSYANGRRIRVSRAAVDTGGHATTQVYTYCKAREPRGVYGVKGQEGDRIPLTRPAKASKTNRYSRLFMVGVDGIKADIMSWLRVGQPGNGYCHFPKGEGDMPVNGIDTDFFAMLTAEKRVVGANKRGFTTYQWVKPSGARNEAWDCFVYARAALRIMSNRDDLMLKRIYLQAPWQGASKEALGDAAASPTEGPGQVPPPRTAPKKRPGKNRNSVAAGMGVQI